MKLPINIFKGKLNSLQTYLIHMNVAHALFLLNDFSLMNETNEIGKKYFFFSKNLTNLNLKSKILAYKLSMA